MTELGSRLRMAREEKGLSLDELQAATKIQKKYLIGIEEGNYEVMPGKFYARAFIKQYAEAVGLEPDELFEEYKSDIPPAYEDDLPEQLSRVQSRGGGFKAGNSKVMDLFPKIAAAVFVIAVLFVIWLLVMKFWGGDGKQPGETADGSVGFKQSEEVKPPEKPAGERESEAGKEDDGAVENEEPEKEDAPASQTLQAAGTSGDQTQYTLTGTDAFGLKMSVVAGRESYVRVRNAAGSTLYEGTLGRGEYGDSKEMDLSGETDISIRVGSTPSLEIFVNGEKLEYEIDPAGQDVQTIKIQFNKTE